MKLTTVLLTLAFLTVSAKTLSQQVTLSGNDLAWEKVFREVKKQTGYFFVFTKATLDKAKLVDVNVQNMPLKDFLDLIFKNQPLKYSIIGTKTINVSPNPTPSEPGEKNSISLPETQEPPLTGRVIDSTGNPLSGATIIIKGKRVSTTTNANGVFSLNVSEGDILQISFVGHEEKELRVTRQMLTGGSSGSVVLLPAMSTMNEVVIEVNTGYQKIPKERATGSFKVIAGDQLDKPASSLSQRLIGTTSGMVAATGADGSASFQIRGLSTLGANASPLIVIDGFAVNETDFANINPNNVENVTVLKDAAAASIWGARAANGVIVVTTKSAKKGMPLSVDVSAFTRIGAKIDLDYARAFANSPQTVDYENMAFRKWGGLSNINTVTNAAYVRSQASTLLNEHYLGNITQQQLDASISALRNQDNSSQIKDLLMANPLTNQINLNVAGGGERITNYFSLMYETNQSAFNGTNNRKVMLNYKTTANVLKWLDFETNFMGQYINAKNNGVTMTDIRSWSPYDMLQNPDGSYADVANHWYMPAINTAVPTDKFPYPDFSYNPVRDMHNRNITAQTLNARVQAGLTAKIMKGVSVTSRIQYNNFNINNRALYNSESDLVRFTGNFFAVWDRTLNGTVTAVYPKGSQLNQSRIQSLGYTWRNQLSIDRSLGGDHMVNVVLGNEISETIGQGFNYAPSYGYDDNTLVVGNFPNGVGGTYPLVPGYRLNSWLGGTLGTVPYTNSFSYNTERFSSFFGNAAYTYKEKYTISASARNDASNLITNDPKYRYSPFWQVGGLWRASREDFMNKIPWLNDLGFRLTFGYQGNVDRSTSFLPLIAIGGTPDAFTGERSNSISSFGNPSLRWERTANLNFGIDFSLFDRKLFGSIEFYRKNGKDLIATLSIPSIDGTPTQRLNNAAMTNQGINIDLGTTIKINRNIKWAANLNFAYNKNKITDLFIANYAYTDLENGAFVEGFDANSMWSYAYAGLVNNYPAIQGPKGSTFLVSAVPTGDAREFMVRSGTTVPPYTIGFTNSFNIYDFNFSFIVTGRFGAKFRRTGFNYPYQQQAGRLLPNARLDEVMNGDPNKILTLPANSNDPGLFNWQIYMEQMGYLIESANVIRMQEINLSYNVRPAIMKRLNIKKGLSVYAQANNLFVIVNNTYKEDPEYPIGTLRPRPQYTLGFKIQL